MSSKDLLLSKPAAFITVRARYEDLAITSLNTILLSQELGMAELADDSLVLKKRMFFRTDSSIGKLAADILDAGRKTSIVLREPASDLYETFRIEL